MRVLSFFTVFALCLSPSRAIAGDTVDYLQDVKPIFAKHCTVCHGPAKQRSQLRLDTAALALKGNREGPVIVPGKSDVSKLVHAISGAGDVSMPPKERPRLSSGEIALIKSWIAQGAKAPKDEIAEDDARYTHWAFQPIRRPALPAVKQTAWPRNPIDRFILARLEAEQIMPSPEADRATLIRRLSLDLLGLPPAVADVDAFVKDDRPDAYERLVDRLLASPHYGERWGRHWLDAARYADSNGFNIDAPRSIWPYRDWVMSALNRDLPFDQFVIQQMAGDLLPDATVETKIATGFHRNTLINQEGGIDLEQFRIESIVDRVNTTGTVFLGLTIGCAQCHDHKFDPISQREYFQLFAFLNNDDEPALALPTPDEVEKTRRIREQLARLKKQLQGLDTTSPAKQATWEKNLTPEQRLRLPPKIKEILDVPDYQRTAQEKKTLAEALRKADQAPQIVGGLGNPLSGGGHAARTVLAVHFNFALHRANLEKRMAELKKQEPVPAKTLILAKRQTPRETCIHIKGDFLRKGKRVEPGVPEVLHPLPAEANGKRTRLDLARWLVDPANPLTARVTMNRLWQAYFGLGLVETDNDFGAQGTPPSHPELLDWLAAEFMGIADGKVKTPQAKWSLKAMHRLIVTSAVYRQASKARPEIAGTDPRNRLLARQNRLRMEGEIVRDVALASSGLLNRKLGGPSVFPPQPAGVFAFTQVQREWKASVGPERFRRGLYTHFWRSAPHPALTVFDAPDSTQTCTRRNRSNTPLQALTLLNDLAFVECAQALALRVLREAPEADRERIRHAFRLCLGRTPKTAEEDRLARLLQTLQTELAAAPEEARKLAPASLPGDVDVAQAAAWTMLARVLMNLDEFITRE